MKAIFIKDGNASKIVITPSSKEQNDYLNEFMKDGEQLPIDCEIRPHQTHGNKFKHRLNITISIPHPFK